MSLGNNSAMVPDFDKGQESAGRIIQLLESESSIDPSSDSGVKPVGNLD